MTKLVSIIACFVMSLFINRPLFAEQELLVDAVLASVDGKPITYTDLAARLKNVQTLSPQELSTNPEARFVLDKMIEERLISGEAEAKHISVSDEELDSYMQEVASRNNLTMEGLIKALENEKKIVADYRNSIRTEILRTKLLQSLIKRGAPVAESEIDQYLKDHPEFGEAGPKVKLFQIYAQTDSTNIEDKRLKLEEALERLKLGAPFEEVAREYSEGNEGREGGSLGLLAQRDLNPIIFDAIIQLKDGEPSAITETPAGLHIFMVASRINESGDKSPAIRAEVKKVLQRERMETKVAEFLTSDLQKNHFVDRKI